MMHPLSFLLILFVSSVAALPATPASQTNPPPTSTDSSGSQLPPTEPPFPTGTSASTDFVETDPTPTPIYSTLIPKFPSNSSSTTNSTSPCASRRPLRLGPARLHKKPSPSTIDSFATGTLTTASNSLAVPAVAVAAAAETPTDSGPRNYASLIPPAPGVTPRPEPNLAEMGYYQTTYYSCVTSEASVHCGWHRPIMVAPAQNAAGSPSADWKAGKGAGIVALVAGVVGVLLAG